MHQTHDISHTGYIDTKACQLLLRTHALITTLWYAQAMDHKVCQLIVIMPALITRWFCAQAMDHKV